jgi:hypothetical protein
MEMGNILWPTMVTKRGCRLPRRARRNALGGVPHIFERYNQISSLASHGGEGGKREGFLLKVSEGRRSEDTDSVSLRSDISPVCLLVPTQVEGQSFLHRVSSSLITYFQ